MIEAFVNKLIKDGQLAAQKAGIIQIEALLKESIIDGSMLKLVETL